MKTGIRNLTILAALALFGVPWASAGDHAYVGAKKCKKCHIKEYNSWAETKMAKSFELLKPGVAEAEKTAAKLDPKKDYTADAACIGCHTTGHGKSGGFKDVASTPDLVGIGCEMCHGPGGDYMQDQYMSLSNKEYKKADLIPLGLISPPTKDQCAQCHNDKSPFFKPFDFEERVKQGTHEKTPLKYQH